MEKQKKLGFFKKMFLAITDFRVYPYILKTENFWKSFGYFLKLILLVSLLITSYIAGSIFGEMDAFIENYNVVVPEFTFQSGELLINESGNVKIDDDTLLIIDTSKTYEEYEKSSEYNENTRYNVRIFVNKDSISYETYYGGGFRFLLGDIEQNFNKTSLYDYISELYESTMNKFIMFFVIYFSTFIGYLFSKVFEILIIALISSVICASFRMKINASNHFKIAFYVVTLPYLLEAISIMCVGSIKEYTVIVTTLLSYIYVFYAVRAIKLDAFLLIVNNVQNKNGNVIITKVDKDGNPIKEDSNNQDEDKTENDDQESKSYDEEKASENKQELESDKENKAADDKNDNNEK